jgi:hypothetical protein
VATQSEQVGALVPAYAMRINALVYSTPRDTEGLLQHRPELLDLFTDKETGAKGTVEIVGQGSGQFLIYLRGTNEQNQSIIEAGTLGQRLGKLLPGKITATEQDELTAVIHYDSTPEQRYVDCANLTLKVIDTFLEQQGPVASSTQRDSRAISSPSTPLERKAGVSVVRTADERGFDVVITPHIKGWSETALIAVLKWLMSNYTIITVNDYRSEKIMLTITP